MRFRTHPQIPNKLSKLWKSIWIQNNEEFAPGLLRGAGGMLTSQHADHREEDLLHALNGAPAFGTALVAHGVISGGVQDGDAHATVGVNCGREGAEGQRHFRTAFMPLRRVQRGGLLRPNLFHGPWRVQLGLNLKQIGTNPKIQKRKNCWNRGGVAG